MNEAALTTKIRLACKKRGAYIFKARGDPRQTKGVPDLVMCYQGSFVAMEVKVPGRERTLTKNQAENIKRIGEAQGYAAVVTTVKQAMEILDEVEEWNDS